MIGIPRGIEGIFVHILSNKNFLYSNNLDSPNLLILVLSVWAILLAYLTYIDRDLRTIWRAKAMKYTVIFFLTLVDMGGIVYSAFNGVNSESINECYFINSLQISIYTTVVLLFVFITQDLLRKWYNIVTHKNITIVELDITTLQ